MIEFVFLDFDDTILDFHMAEAEALKKTLLMVGRTPTEEMLQRYSVINDAQWKLLELGKLTRAQVKLRRFELFFKEFDIQYDAETAWQYYEKQIGIGHYFISGAEEMLRALCGKYRLFLVSNGSSAVQKGRLESAKIAPMFEGIFLSEEVGYVKPQAEFFEHCFSRIPNFSKDRAIIFGDSLTSDILGGINAGIRTCWFNPKGLPPREDIRADLEVSALTDFPKCIEML